MATPHPIDPAEQLLLRSYRSALSQLRSSHCLRLMAYSHSVGWADDPTCPNCHSTGHTVAHLFSCPTHSTNLAPGDMWTTPLQVTQFLAGLPQFSDLPQMQIDFDSFPSYFSFLLLAFSFLATGGTTSSSSHPSPHFITPVVWRSSDPSANQQQQGIVKIVCLGEDISHITKRC